MTKIAQLSNFGQILTNDQHLTIVRIFPTRSDLAQVITLAKSLRVGKIEKML